MNPMDRLDPELIEPLTNLIEATGGGFDLSDIPGTRRMTDQMVAAVNADAPPIDGVTSEDLEAPSSETGVGVPIRVHRPSAADGPRPALLWMHPGGYVIGSRAMEDLTLKQWVRDLGIVAINVEYRLAPEHPYPAPLEDCHGALTFAGEHAAELGIDPVRIAVGGASAGGGLAAALALLARDRGGVQPAFQVLVYPAIDDTNIEPASDTVPENLFWSRENARIGWNAYLEGREATADVPAHAAVARADDLAGLPDAFIGVGSADMFVGENIAYAERLSAAGSRVELRVYPGAFHAFDSFAPMARVSKQFAADKEAALRRALL